MHCEYASNSLIRSYPDGMDTQVFALETLKRSAAMTNDPLDREHVTLHICTHPELFRQVSLIASPDLYWPELGLTLDEKKDYELLKNLIEYFGPSKPYFSCREVIELLKTKPEWVAINQEVRRKGDFVRRFSAAIVGLGQIGQGYDYDCLMTIWFSPMPPLTAIMPASSSWLPSTLIRNNGNDFRISLACPPIRSWKLNFDIGS